MQKVKILGICGSPRKDGNTAKLVAKALEGALSVPGVETELYQMAGKKFQHCLGCQKCLELGKCILKDDMTEFARKYIESDGLIIGAPVYHMGVPSLLKAALDRFGNALLCTCLMRDQVMPRLCKVSGAVTGGLSRNGGQELVMSWLANSTLLMNDIAVAGDTLLGAYIGGASHLVGPPEMNRLERTKNKDIVLLDQKGLDAAFSTGKRVAELTKVVKAGLISQKKDLGKEYFFSWEDLGWD